MQPPQHGSVANYFCNPESYCRYLNCAVSQYPNAKNYINIFWKYSLYMQKWHLYHWIIILHLYKQFNVGLFSLFW